MHYNLRKKKLKKKKEKEKAIFEFSLPLSSNFLFIRKSF
jgi:hypothetical protein